MSLVLVLSLHSIPPLVALVNGLMATAHLLRLFPCKALIVFDGYNGS